LCWQRQWCGILTCRLPWLFEQSMVMMSDVRLYFCWCHWKLWSVHTGA
jgi:hypothetical protein